MIIIIIIMSNCPASTCAVPLLSLSAVLRMSEFDCDTPDPPKDKPQYAHYFYIMCTYIHHFYIMCTLIYITFKHYDRQLLNWKHGNGWDYFDSFLLEQHNQWLLIILFLIVILNDRPFFWPDWSRWGLMVSQRRFSAMVRLGAGKPTHWQDHPTL